MDALSNPRPTDPVVTRLRPGDGALSLDASSCVPPEAPLAMPTQSLTRFNRAERHKNLNRHRVFGCWLARVFVFGGGL
ncbi:MAG: glucan biosynthesis glucosyltransferase H, partial [Methylocella sp.]